MMNQSKESARELAWDACFNVRDLGGYVTSSQRETRWGAFVRSDSLHRLNPTGETAFVEYGIRTVIDLRTHEEVGKAPNAFMRQQANDGAPLSIHIPIIDSTNLRWQQGAGQIFSMPDMYSLMLDAFSSQFAAVMKAIAQAAPGTVAFYCHAGKDRTGLVSALLLALVDVPHTIIAIDYATSDQNLETVYEELRREAADKPEELLRMTWLLQSLPETMMTTLEYLDKSYGGAEAYLQSSGVSRAEIEQIRSRLLA